MSWLDKLEKKFPRFGIQNITYILVSLIVIGYIVSLTAPVMLLYLTFEPYYIFHGQVWRLFTWLLVPPDTGGYLVTILFLLCAVSWGKSLERMIGNFRVTVFVLGGILISDIGGIILYFIFRYVLKAGAVGGVFWGFPLLTSYYLILTMLMLVALLFPEGIVRFWFILPMKMMWMFYLTIAELVYEIGSALYQVIASGYGLRLAIILTLVMKAQIVLALINLFVFYLASKNRVTHAQRRRQHEFRQQYQQAAPRPGSGITKHKCAICGRTEVSNPELLFRYCSKCPSGLEYCSDHLFTHTHK